MIQLPWVLWFFFCVGLHGYGLFVAETSRMDMNANPVLHVYNQTTEEKEVKVLCSNATDWVLVLSCFFIATSGLMVLSYYIVYPWWFSITNPLPVTSGEYYRYYEERLRDHVTGSGFVCLPL